MKHKVVILADDEYDEGVDPFSTTLITLEIFNTVTCDCLNFQLPNIDQKNVKSF